jgi:hypothetical protein
MTDDRHREAVRSYYDYVDDEDYEALFDLFASDVVYHRPGQPPIDGMAAFETFYREERPIDEGRHTVDDLVVGAGTVAARGRFEGVLDGQSVSFRFADFHEFDDEGAIARRFSYTDRDEV